MDSGGGGRPSEFPGGPVGQFGIKLASEYPHSCLKHVNPGGTTDSRFRGNSGGPDP